MKTFFLLVLLYLPAVFYGTILYVPDEYANIQIAISYHETGDTVLVAPGIYYENIIIPDGQITLASMYLLTNDTSYISQTILDGGGLDRVIHIYGSPMRSTICGLTIRNGYTNLYGGGICIEGASPIIRNCVITDNVADNAERGGGGIACFTTWWGTTNTILKDIIIKNNKAINGRGGGMYCNQVEVEKSTRNVSTKLENVVFINNTANLSGGGLACWGYSSSVLNNVRFVGNTATLFDGGGLVVDFNSDCEINNVLFEFNSCAGNGGAINCNGGFFKLTNATIKRNYAAFGGGLYTKQLWHAKFKNLLIENNYAEAMGGGIYFRRAISPSLKNITFTENRAETGTAIFCVDDSNLELNSCILYGLMPQQIVFSDTGRVNTIRINYTNIQGGQYFIETNDNGIVEWGEGNLNRNPMFVGLGNYPYQISDNSWCIDAGDPDTTGLLNMVDLAGEPRLINDRVDMGAYEWNLMVGTPVHKNNMTSNLLVFPNPFTTSTTIAYQLQQPETVQITIFNHLGQQVHFIQENQTPGNQQIIWDAKGLPSGMYFYSIQTGTETTKGKLLVVQ